MPTVRGRSAVKRHIADVGAKLVNKVVVGAARAAGNVVADEAKLAVYSDAVREGVTVNVRRRDDHVVVTVGVKAGWARSLGIWLEYGTDPHFIRVAEDKREGRSIGRINKLSREGSLVIGGKFVGDTVFHTGSRAFPFLRPALDKKGGEAIAAAQGFINIRVGKRGVDVSGIEDEA